MPYESATEISKKVQTGAVSAEEVVESHLERINDRNQNVRAFINVLEEDALNQANEVDKRVRNGEETPLAGVPIAIKDLGYKKKGVPCTMGLEPLRDNIAEDTNEITARLEKAGAVIVGTTNTPEIGHSVKTKNSLVGATATPFDLNRNSAGSSGGSAAALADGMCALATGSDVGGSLRNPASCCGVASVKPSHGLIPRGNWVNGFRGHTPVGVLGPMARSVEDLALLLDVMAGRASVDPFSVPKQTGYLDSLDEFDGGDLSVAFSADLGVFSVEEGVREAVRDSLSRVEGSGVDVNEVELDLPAKTRLTFSYGAQVATFFATAVAEIEEDLGIDLIGDYGDDLPSDLLDLVSMGESNDVLDYTRADFVRTELYRSFEELFIEYDALVCPTLSTPPLGHDEPIPSEIDGVQTGGLPTDWMLSWIFNMTGHPVVNLPAGLVDGLPVGMQVIGETYTEDALLGIASVIEEASPWSYPGE